MFLLCVAAPLYYVACAQAVQRFETIADLDTHKTTVEEKEEYEQHIRNGVVVYAGVVSLVNVTHNQHHTAQHSMA